MYAQDAHTISQPDVLARWGYSEVINSHSENCYADVPNINEIRKKRESGMPCSELTEDERRALAIACTNCRPVLTNFLAGITRFQLKPVSRQYVGALLVAPCVWHPESKGEFVRFAEWVGIPPLTDHPADARNVICRPVYEPPTDALAIGRHNAEPSGPLEMRCPWCFVASVRACLDRRGTSLSWTYYGRHEAEEAKTTREGPPPKTAHR
jgi:hypothetical protein